MRARGRWTVAFAGLGLAVFALALANLGAGSVSVPLPELAHVLLEGPQVPSASTFAQVIWSIRLPRLVAAGILGSALALAGLLLQAFFANPIAGPFVLGISSGAKLAVAVLMVAVVGSAGVVSSWMQVAAATLGSAGVTLLVLLVSRRVSSASSLIVAGVLIGYVCNAATDVLVTFASDASIANLRNWSLGTFSGTSWDDVRTMAVVVTLAATCVFLLSKPLGAYQLGEGYAQSVGVSVGAFRVTLIVLSSVLAATVTAFAGPISFVGIAVPHLAKRLMRTSRPIVVVPAAFLGGMAFCLLSDLIARTALAPTELSVSTVTAVLGTPVVMGILLGRRTTARPSVTTTVASFRSATITAPTKNGHPAPPDFSSAKSPQVDGYMQKEDIAARAFLQAHDVAAGYGSSAVVTDVSLKVAAGQIVTLVGPNGAGKSTLLKTLAGQLEPLAGEVWLGERNVSGLTEAERALRRAVLLTDRPHPELLTCEDVVGMGRYPHTGRLGRLNERDHVAVREAMELMCVWGLRARDFAELSDGQRQRVMLARAICQETSVLMLDEPTGYLDIRYQIELLGVLRQLAARGVGVVMALHELSLARQVSDWVVCVKDGAVQAQGTPAEVFVPEVIDALYDLEPGTYDPLTGHIKLNQGDVSFG